MQRSIKYGLSSAALATLITGTVAWSSGGHTVHLVVDGVDHTVSTDAATVAGALREAGFAPRPHDLVAPAPSSAVHDGSRIVLRRARLLVLDIDGRREQVWTTAQTVSAALSELGYDQADFVSVSRSQRLPLSPTDISIRTPKLLTVIYGGHRHEVTTTAATAAEVFSELGITVGPFDRLSQPADSPVHGGETIKLTQIDRKRVTRVQTVRAPVRRIDDPYLAAGQTRVVKPGRDGSARVSFVEVFVDGKLAERSRPQVVTLIGSRPRVVRVGIAPAPSGSDPSPASLQAYARALLPQYGWGDDQFSCLVTMWDHESGWRVHAVNPSSGAYGIPQALPADKMGPGWQDDGGVQIRWGLQYIKDRYVSPCDAWAFWQQGSWY